MGVANVLQDALKLRISIALRFFRYARRRHGRGRVNHIRRGFLNGFDLILEPRIGGRRVEIRWLGFLKQPPNGK